ncbi:MULTISPECIES: M15 family metallopeptidase [unclassified Phaeobacter]|uniref:M15 family metallopeptidase n=1 Tax=unclassified Phaeobacter TaxID=2621772 RepID=UPI003A85669C
MSYSFSKRSMKRAEGVHPDLVAVMKLAISRSPVDFTVLEGLRTKERQRQLVKSGASKTMNSRHLTGHAIDVAPLLNGEVSWDWPLYHQIAPVIKDAAEELAVDIEWGGDWTSFKDGPHWQLSWNTYGKDDMAPRARVVRPDFEPQPSPAAVKRPWWLTLINSLLKGFRK